MKATTLSTPEIVRRRAWAIVCACLAASLLAPAGVEAISPVFSTSAGAIRGYDPVAYFTQNAPVQGKKELSHKWGGATWHFASEENRRLFRENPEKYAPQYGGYCAYAVSQGYTASVDPDAWRIVDGRLYLNYSKAVQRAWERDIPGHIRQGDRNWPRLLEKN